MRVFTTLFLGIILAAGPAVVSSHAQTPAGQTPPAETGKGKKHKTKHVKPKKNKKEKTSS